MNAVLNSLEFAKAFERAGFDHDKAHALADAFVQAHDASRDDLVTKSDLNLRLAEFEARLNKQLGDMEARSNKQLGDIEVRLTRQVGEVGKDISARLWSTIAVIAGVSTAISATVGAGVAMLIKAGGL